MVSAQLVVFDFDLEDEDGNAFTTEKNLKARGLPIYVFEQNDMEELIAEESGRVR